MTKRQKALTLSIVIPVYNEELHLPDCLNAIAAQKTKPDEVIVVDNNSTDKSVAIARSYDFVHIISEKKPGVLAARTAGFNAATGDILGRIDADTILEPTWVGRVRKDFASVRLAGVTGPTSWYDMPLSSYNHVVDHMFKGPLSRFAKNFPFLFGTNMAVRRSAWEEIQPSLCTGGKIHEDTDLAIHLFKAGYYLRYDRKLRAGMSARRWDDKLRDFYDYLQKYRAMYRDHGIKTVGPQVASAAYGIGYLIFQPLRRTYNPRTKRYSLGHWAKGGNKPRKSPLG